MNASTLFLSQLIGPIGVITALMILFNKKGLADMIKGLEKEPLALYMAAITTLVASLALVLSHNVWNNAAETIISLIGWLGLIKGILLMIAPDHLISFSKSMMEKIMLGGIFWLVLGGYLTYVGYFM